MNDYWNIQNFWTFGGETPGVESQHIIQEWREKILNRLLQVAVIVGMIILAPNIVLSFQEGLWGIAVFDIVVYASVLGVYLHPTLAAKQKATLFVGCIYLLGIGLSLMMGHRVASLLWLFIFPIFTGVFFGIRAVVLSLILNAFAYGMVALVEHSGLMHWVPSHSVDVFEHITIGFNFLVANSLATLPIAYLFRGLETTLYQQEQTTAKLEESETKYRAIFQNIRDALFVLEITPDGLPGAIVEVNDIACQRLGYTRDELVGMTLRDIDAPGSSEAILGIMETLLNEGSAVFERTHVTKSGKTIPVEISAQRFTMDGHDYIMSAAQDVSERQALRKELIQAQRMEAMGQLAGGIAHDFNNVLAAINGAAQMMELQVEQTDLDKYIRMIQSSVKRGDTITSRLLTFTRTSEPLIQPTDLAPLLRDFTAVAETVLPTNINLHLELPEENIVGEIDPGQVEQVLFTLCINAADAMREGGDVWIRLREAGTQEVEHGAKEPNRQYCCIEVEDEGLGMSAEVQKQIFTPFFTTKGENKGTGLGLTVAKKIIDLHQGWIEVSSTPGKGTTFIMGLLQSDQLYRSSEDTREESAPLADHCHLHILVIEDEEQQRDILKEAFTARGCQITTGGSGKEAMDKVNQRDHPFDLILMDAGLPDISSWTLVQQIRAVSPDITIVAITGYVDKELRESLMATGVDLVLQKPFDINKLIQEIRSVINA